MTRLVQSDAAAICARAWAIVNRLHPDVEPAVELNPHNPLARPAWIEVCRYRDARNRLYKRIFWRLADKAAKRGQLVEARDLGDGRYGVAA